MTSITPTIRRRTNRLSLRRRDGLMKYAHNNTSQNGEDGIIYRLFNVLLPSPLSKSRYCVDVGAWDGVHLSNTHSLLVGNTSNAVNEDGVTAITNNTWNGVLIEANAQRFQELKKLHDPLNNICICAEVSSAANSSNSLVSILQRDAPHMPNDFDFLSIDVDGMDYWLLANLFGIAVSSTDGIVDDNDDTTDIQSKRENCYRPKVICIEFNPTMPIDIIYIQPCADNIRHGSSLSALVELANAANYTLIETTLYNAFFVTNELYEQYLMKEIPDTSIETLHEVTMGSELYQLYDGTLCLWGCKKLLWHRIPINEEKIQMLAPEDRVFPFAPSIVEQQSSHQCVGKGRLKHQTQNKGSQLECFRKIRETAVDMSPYCNTFATIDMKRECSTKLNATIHQDGFAFLRGLGIPNNVCNNALCAARSFLHEANESVRRSCLTTDRARRGYSPLCTENFASLMGEHGPNDLVKKYRIGPSMMSCDENNEGGTTLSQHPTMSSLHQPNVWPANDANFKSAIEEYFNAICHAANCVLRAICDEIIDSNQNISIVESMKTLSELMYEDDRTNGDKSTNHTSILTLLGYQPGSRHKKGSKAYMRPLVSAHTDVGVITVLLFDNGSCATLERAANAPNNANTDNTIEWLDVTLPTLKDDNDPIFVVNVGDCLSDVSGGMLRSTLHRVMPRPCHLSSSHDTLLDDKVARTCLALFVGLDPSALLTLPSGEVLSYEEWRRRRIARAQAVMKCNN